MVNTKNDYYKKEYERIVNRFIWNISIYGSMADCYDACYQEAVDEIEKLYQKAYGSEDITSGLRYWALSTIKRYYLTNKKNVSGWVS
ncbi:hypothetical protein [Streptococcus gallolyticus]|uniref:Uncharacterized protein n=1 Tax=Streptococcus gallolyticus TaxID=315405 RepID=A0A1H9P9B4_9STRE|nr:hypothetical protein [Streptococcus gallolyticus]SER44505.1 hypothetical protein SAMN04487840_10442 [Streptococcus gallolyticus]